MMTKEEAIKIMNFTIPGAGVLVPWRGHIVNMHYVNTTAV